MDFSIFKALKIGPEYWQLAFCLDVAMAVTSSSDTSWAICDVLEAVRASASRTHALETNSVQH